MDYLLHTKQLTVGYDGKPLIRDIEIRLKKGRILTLIGPNGSGKSTILKTITKYIKNIAGTVYIGGFSLDDMTNRDLSYKMSVVLTQKLKTEMMTCEDVVSTGRYPYTGNLGILSEKDKMQVDDAMGLVNIIELKDRDFTQISDGQRQRVLLARAICQEPEIIVLDEPTSYLDIRYEMELLNTLCDMAHRRGIAVIMSLHELDLAERVSDDVICIKGDTISHYGSANEIFKRDLIHDLYDITSGSYNPLFGSIEMQRPEGEPKTFVIAGGGTGIGTYRNLQKKGIPFFTGILQENDVDYQVARDLASVVISERSFERITDATYKKAVESLYICDSLINCLRFYGEMNIKNLELFDKAKSMGLRILKDCDAIQINCY
ncbi:MAG: ABC transporter ATP-binding protein [Clostridia bacterium]